MRNINSLFVTIIILWLPQLILSQSGHGTNQMPAEDSLERKVPGDTLEYLTTRQAFSQGLRLTRTAGGVASIASDCEEEPITQRWMPLGASLRNVLDAIVSKDLRYRWDFDDGVINLIPRDGEPALLSTHIRRFLLDKPTAIDYAVNQLLALPEVQEQESRLHISPGVQLLSGPVPMHDTKITLQLENITLKEMLNAIVRTHGRAVWSYREHHCGGQRVFLITFIVK